MTLVLVHKHAQTHVVQVRVPEGDRLAEPGAAALELSKLHGGQGGWVEGGQRCQTVEEYGGPHQAEESPSPLKGESSLIV